MNWRSIAKHEVNFARFTSVEQLRAERKVSTTLATC
jgi:hypothetical protein